MLLIKYDQNIIEYDKRFFVYSKIDYSVSGNTSSIDFVCFKGIDITTFLAKERVDLLHNDQLFFKQYQSYIESKEMIVVRFNKLIPWQTYSNL